MKNTMTSPGHRQDVVAQKILSHGHSGDPTRKAKLLEKCLGEGRNLGKPYPIGSMYAIYGNIYHQYTPNVMGKSTYTGWWFQTFFYFP